MAATRHNVDASVVLTNEHEYVLHPWAVQSQVNAPVIVGAKGCTLWDAHDKEYLDFSSQMSNVNLGHQDPRIIDAIISQAQQLCYIAPTYLNEQRGRLGALLAELTPGDLGKTYFTVGGSEANEVAIQLARLYTGRAKIISFYRSYHGATYGAISVSGGVNRLSAGFGIPGVVHALDLSADHIERLIQLEGADNVAAVILEPVRSDSVLVPPPHFLQELRDVCDRYGVLLIFDEVVTGCGRTGRWFACEHWGVVPDIMTLAKGLNSGYAALGAVVVNERMARYFDDHLIPFGFTNGGHPLAFAVAQAVLQAYREDRLIERAAALEGIIREELRQLQAKHPSVGDVRGIGLWFGMDLVKKQTTREPLVSPLAPRNVASSGILDGFKQHLVERGLIALMSANLLRIQPPLCVTDDELYRGLEIIDEALELTDALVQPT